MKKHIIVLLLLISFTTITAQETAEITTYFFIRHAEKVRTNPSEKNPNLTEKGKRRANTWNTVFKNVPFDMIFSTNYNRTLQTATPTALSKKLVITPYNPRALYSEEFQKQTKGKTVLVVGHSNTTPSFANKIIGADKYPQIEDTNNANLYIVTITGNTVTSILLQIPSL